MNGLHLLGAILAISGLVFLWIDKSAYNIQKAMDYRKDDKRFSIIFDVLIICIGLLMLVVG